MRRYKEEELALDDNGKLCNARDLRRRNRSLLVDRLAENSNKFNARKKQVFGIWFDSTHEATVYLELRALQEAGQIVDLQRQVWFHLQDAYKTPAGKRVRAIRAKYDFVVVWKSGYKEVVEAKGKATPHYLDKAKMFRKRYPELPLREVYKR